MFTGLIQCKGQLLRLTPAKAEARLLLRPLKPLAPFSRGESIAVNGVCLTVEDFTQDAGQESFSAYASTETLERSNLGLLRPGAEVNLERALRLGDSLGGHLVSGHVDALCELAGLSRHGASLSLRFTCPPEQGRYIAAKGSVTLDGISLTVNTVGPDYFEVNVIPATMQETTVSAWSQGRRVNLETDILAKYVERLLLPGGAENKEKRPGLELDFFQEHGFA